MAKVIVTGGAGFIGSHLVDSLVTTRHRVTVVDNLSVGKRENIPAGVELIREDIRSPRMKDVWRDVQPEVVFHLAAQKNLRTSVEQPLFDADVNIAGSLNLLEQSRRFNTKRFIFASTAGVYPDTKRLPIHETLAPQPVSPYGIGKYTIEQYLRFFTENFGLSTISLRFANAYGPRQDADGEAGVIALFFQLVQAQQPLTINGTGRQTRDFIYVSDLVRASMAAMKLPRVTGEVNISTAKQSSIVALASAIQKVSGQSRRPKHRRAITGEVTRSALSWSQAHKQLKWKPQVSLLEGLRQTWEWRKQHPS